VQSKLYFLAREDDRRALQDIIASREVQTLHSQEASLEQIFIRLTGRELSA
jgi:fluoroquinolone transport system ATP-binding protein